MKIRGIELLCILFILAFFSGCSMMGQDSGIGMHGVSSVAPKQLIQKQRDDYSVYMEMAQFSAGTPGDILVRVVRTGDNSPVVSANVQVSARLVKSDAEESVAGAVVSSAAIATQTATPGQYRQQLLLEYPGKYDITVSVLLLPEGGQPVEPMVVNTSQDVTTLEDNSIYYVVGGVVMTVVMVAVML